MPQSWLSVQRASRTGRLSSITCWGGQCAAQRCSHCLYTSHLRIWERWGGDIWCLVWLLFISIFLSHLICSATRPSCPSQCIRHGSPWGCCCDCCIILWWLNPMDTGIFVLIGPDKFRLSAWGLCLLVCRFSSTMCILLIRVLISGFMMVDQWFRLA